MPGASHIQTQTFCHLLWSPSLLIETGDSRVTLCYLPCSSHPSHSPWPRGHQYCSLSPTTSSPLSPSRHPGEPSCHPLVSHQGDCRACCLSSPHAKGRGVGLSCPLSAPCNPALTPRVEPDMGWGAATVRTDDQGITAFSLLKTGGSSVAPSAFGVASDPAFQDHPGPFTVATTVRPCLVHAAPSAHAPRTVTVPSPFIPKGPSSAAALQGLSCSCQVGTHLRRATFDPTGLV